MGRGKPDRLSLLLYSPQYGKGQEGERKQRLRRRAVDEFNILDGEQRGRVSASRIQLAFRVCR